MSYEDVQPHPCATHRCQKRPRKRPIEEQKRPAHFSVPAHSPDSSRRGSWRRRASDTACQKKNSEVKKNPKSLVHLLQKITKDSTLENVRQRCAPICSAGVLCPYFFFLFFFNLYQRSAAFCSAGVLCPYSRKSRSSCLSRSLLSRSLSCVAPCIFFLLLSRSLSCVAP